MNKEKSDQTWDFLLGKIVQKLLYNEVLALNT